LPRKGRRPLAGPGQLPGLAVLRPIAPSRTPRRIDPFCRQLHGGIKSMQGGAMSGIERARLGHKRSIVYGLLFTMTLINYFDRTVLSIAMPVLIHEFALTPVAVGYLLSAFIWSYAPCQLPAGVLLDRWGTRATAARCIAFWSAATALTGAASSFTFVFFTRLLLGIGESPTFRWLPERSGNGRRCGSGRWRFPSRDRVRRLAPRCPRSPSPGWSPPSAGASPLCSPVRWVLSG
jgi:hypothetical protein